MGAVYFYHLTRHTLDEALPRLLQQSLDAGWRVAVRGPDRARLTELEAALWRKPEDGFLPHGLAGGPHDPDQPVLLTDAADHPNGARCVMSVHGAEVAADEVARLDRVCVLFDGNDPVALDRARDQWRALTGAGCAAIYWSEESGRWEKKTER